MTRTDPVNPVAELTQSTDSVDVVRRTDRDHRQTDKDGGQVTMNPAPNASRAGGHNESSSASGVSTQPTPPLNVLSLFAGIAGLELGLERAGMRVVGQVELSRLADAERSLANAEWVVERARRDLAELESAAVAS